MAGLDNFWAKVSEEVRRQAEEKHSSEVKTPKRGRGSWSANLKSDAQYFVFIS